MNHPNTRGLGMAPAHLLSGGSQGLETFRRATDSSSSVTGWPSRRSASFPLRLARSSLRTPLGYSERVLTRRQVINRQVEDVVSGTEPTSDLEPSGSPVPLGGPQPTPGLHQRRGDVHRPRFRVLHRELYRVRPVVIEHDVQIPAVLL